MLINTFVKKLVTSTVYLYLSIQWYYFPSFCPIGARKVKKVSFLCSHDTGNSDF